MNKSLTLILFLIPMLLFSEEKKNLEVYQIDVVVKVLSMEYEELWSVNLKKYTISGRSISLNLKGFDGELKATMTPVSIDSQTLLLKATSSVKSLETNLIIKQSTIELTTGFDEKIILFPIGNIKDTPNVILELNIIKLNGVSD